MGRMHARDTSFCLVSIAPLNKIEKFKKRMEWTYRWYSSEGSDFNKDFGLTTEKNETYGLSVFIRDGKKVYRTYFTNGRRRGGAEHLDDSGSDADGPAGRLAGFTGRRAADQALCVVAAA